MLVVSLDVAMSSTPCGRFEGSFGIKVSLDISGRSLIAIWMTEGRLLSGELETSENVRSLAESRRTALQVPPYGLLDEVLDVTLSPGCATLCYADDSCGGIRKRLPGETSVRLGPGWRWGPLQ